MIDLSPYPVVDSHCHPFVVRQGELTPGEFLGLLAFSGDTQEFLMEGGVANDADLAKEVEGLRRDVIYSRYVIHQMARFFDCEPTLQAVVEERNKASQEYPNYVRRLFTHCQLGHMVVDFGYPAEESLSIARFSSEVPVDVVPVYRIESAIDRLVATEIGWHEFRRLYDDAVADALERGGYRGLKSVIAYHTGLDISPASRDPGSGLSSLDKMRQGNDEAAEKGLRDHLLCRALELCMEYDVPMQLHTGIGDAGINLVLSRPALLLDLLRSSAFRSCKVVLVHAGFPYHSEAGYLARVLPRVYCGVSEGIPFAASGARRIYLEILEMAPISKVLYGSDGYNLPEMSYIGATLGKTALSEALEDLVSRGMLSNAEALEAGQLVLAGNTSRLYSLDLT
jgi:predicted TIM-barrel fold metal-dependent hydrolase